MLSNPEPNVGDAFGYAVAVTGDYALVSAPNDDTGATDAGSVYLFSAATGDLLRTFRNPEPATGDLFGRSVALHGDTVLIGAYSDDAAGTDAGTVYLFSASTGQLLRVLRNPSPDPADNFGRAVAAGGGYALVGAVGDDTAGAGAGAAYLFGLTHRPTAVDDAVFVAEDGGWNALNLLANDAPPADIGGPLTLVALTNPAHGTLQSVGTNPGATLLYRPDPDYNGPDSFTYQVTDGRGVTATATVYITLTPVNDPPVATPDSAAVAEDGSVLINVQGNDSTGPDAGETLAVQAYSQAAHGTVTPEAGQLRYTPARDYNGADSFLYLLGDGNGGLAVATVSLTVTQVNDPPVANPDYGTTDEDTPLTLNVLANDSAGPTPDEGPPSSLSVLTVSAGHGQVTLTGGGWLTYVPDHDFAGADVITYTVGDLGATNHVPDPKFATGSVYVTVTPVNDAPTIQVPGAQTMYRNGTLTLSNRFAVSDVDAGDATLLVQLSSAQGTIVVGPAGTAAVFGNGSANVGLFGPQASVNAALADVTFRPAAGFAGTAQLTALTNDLGNTGAGGSRVAMDSVTITVLNRAPVRSMPALAYRTRMGVPLVVSAAGGLQRAFTDPDGDPLTVRLSTPPKVGTLRLNPDGSFRYTPRRGFRGKVTFQVQASDGLDSSDPVTVTITVL
jgi:hypothetical protein